MDKTQNQNPSTSNVGSTDAKKGQQQSTAFDPKKTQQNRDDVKSNPKSDTSSNY